MMAVVSTPAQTTARTGETYYPDPTGRRPGGKDDPFPPPRTAPVDPQPTAAVVRSRPWQVALAGLLVAVAFAFHTAIVEMVRVWVKYPDYSHGFLVPVFATYLLYARRQNGGLFGDWSVIAPPLIVTEAEVDEIVERLGRTVDDTAAELLG